MYTLLLNHIARYITLDAQAQQTFCAVLEQKKLRRNQYLLQEGDICKRDYFVTKGGVRQYEVDAEGRERIIHFGFEDWWITDRYSLLLQKSAEDRYDAFLEDYGAIEQRLSQQHIASYLGITRETLSRIRRQAAGKG